MTANSKDILDPSALLALLPTLLPKDSKALVSPQDAVAALVHTIFSAVAFRLISVDDASAVDPSKGNVLPKEWNKNGPGSYTLRYKHNHSSLEFVVKVSKLGGRTILNAIAVETDKVATLDVSTADFTSGSFFPHTFSENNETPLVHGFISSNRVADLTSQFKLKVLQKLIPGLRKEGYTEEIEHETSSTTASSSAQASRGPPPSRPQPVHPPDAPLPGQFPRSHIPPDNPLEIGRRDLDPIPRNPFAPPPMFPNAGGDGMFVGPDHPIFGDRRPARDPFGNTGPWGGDGFLPPMGAPPGARFDPVGPGPFQPRRGGPLGGGFPGGGNMRGPDNDEFMPPGMHDSMFS